MLFYRRLLIADGESLRVLQDKTELGYLKSEVRVAGRTLPGGTRIRATPEELSTASLPFRVWYRLGRNAERTSELVLSILSNSERPLMFWAWGNFASHLSLWVITHIFGRMLGWLPRRRLAEIQASDQSEMWVVNLEGAMFQCQFGGETHGSFEVCFFGH